MYKDINISYGNYEVHVYSSIFPSELLQPMISPPPIYLDILFLQLLYAGRHSCLNNYRIVPEIFSQDGAISSESHNF